MAPPALGIHCGRRHETVPMRISNNKEIVRKSLLYPIMEKWEGKPGALAKGMALVEAVLHIAIISRSNIFGIPTSYVVSKSTSFSRPNFNKDLPNILEPLLASPVSLRQLSNLLRKVRPTSAMGFVLFIEVAFGEWNITEHAEELIARARAILNTPEFDACGKFAIIKDLVGLKCMCLSVAYEVYDRSLVLKQSRCRHVSSSPSSEARFQYRCMYKITYYGADLVLFANSDSSFIWLFICWNEAAASCEHQALANLGQKLCARSSSHLLTYSAVGKIRSFIDHQKFARQMEKVDQGRDNQQAEAVQHPMPTEQEQEDDDGSPPPLEDPTENVEDNDDQGNESGGPMKQVQFSLVAC